MVGLRLKPLGAVSPNTHWDPQPLGFFPERGAVPTMLCGPSHKNRLMSLKSVYLPSGSPTVSQFWSFAVTGFREAHLSFKAEVCAALKEMEWWEMKKHLF